MENTRDKGISLIVLVITIIVIIILATAVIITLNQSGIISKADEAAVLTEIGNIEDSASLIYMDMLSEKYTNGGKNPEFADIVNELIKKGYKIETVEYNGYKYIVHPAFETNLDNGGWDKDLEGFWTAKYEMSRTDATVSSDGSGTTFLSKPSVQSARSICIGDMYQYSRSYDVEKESHMMKNSEWGAVAYLTQSKYGRNGYEIDINNSAYVTGNGGGSTTELSSSGIINAYNSEIGAKASTTEMYMEYMT